LECCRAVVGGVDKTQCCASNGLTGDCLAVCSGNITNFPANVLDCQAHINVYYSCYDALPTTTVTPALPGDCLLHNNWTNRVCFTSFTRCAIVYLCILWIHIHTCLL